MLLNAVLYKLNFYFVILGNRSHFYVFSCTFTERFNKCTIAQGKLISISILTNSKKGKKKEIVSTTMSREVIFLT